MRTIFALFVFLFFLTHVFAQTTDSLISRNYPASKTKATGVKKFILPATLLAGGAILTQFKNPDALLINHHQTLSRTILKSDDYLQYLPGIAAFGLDIAGVKGRHNLADKLFLAALSSALEVGVTEGLKRLTHRLRPDSSTYNSFPSGHTATAFTMAEFMNQEYGARSPWYSVGGYSIAAATGALRLYKNRHWLSDVIAGAGIGIGVTRLAYAIYPELEKLFSGHKKGYSFIYLPYYNNGAGGLTLTVHHY